MNKVQFSRRSKSILNHEETKEKNLSTETLSLHEIVLTGTLEDIEKLEEEIYRMFHAEKKSFLKVRTRKNHNDKICDSLKIISQ